MTSSLPSPWPGVPGFPTTVHGSPGGAIASVSDLPMGRPVILDDRRLVGRRDLAYATALADAADRMGDAASVAELWPLVAEEAITLIAAAGAAVVEHRGRSWSLLAARVHDPAGATTRIAAAINAAARRGLLADPGMIDDLGTGASPADWRALLVTNLDRRLIRVRTRLLWFADRPGAFAGCGDVADLLSRHAGAAARVVAGRESLNLAVTARQRVGQAVGILMARRRLAAETAYALLQDRSQQTNTKLRTIAEQVIWTGDLPAED